MEIPSKDQNTIENLNTKLNDFLSEDFEICPEKLMEPLTDTENEVENIEETETKPKSESTKVPNETTAGTADQEQAETEAKFKKMKIDNELSNLKKRNQESNEQTQQQQVRLETDLINDDDLSISLKNLLGKLNNSK